MLASLFGKKSDHPMADIKSAQALLEDLPKNDAHKMLLELTEWLESVKDASNFKLDYQFAVICLLDETAQPYVRKLARDYFAQIELNQFQENRLWLALGNFYRHAALAYLTLFNHYQQNDKRAASLRLHMPLIVGRAVYALRGQLKYVCSHYGPVDQNIWANIALLYRDAESRLYIDSPARLYAAQTEDSSVKQEVARLLAWYGAGVANLSPVYLHLTERIFAQYCGEINIHSPSQNPPSVEKDIFSFDLNRAVAPVRVSFDAAVHPAVRFVSMNNLQAKLEGLLKTLEKNIVPSDLNLLGNYDAETVREAVLHVLTYLLVPPLRRAVRREVKVDLNIALGFPNVLERTEVGLDFNSAPLVQWQVEDISPSGFHTVLPANANMHIGNLLGLQPAGVPHWGVAVVRRMLRDESNKLHLGAEILANKIAGVVLSQSGGGSPGFEEGQPALWLYGKGDETASEVRLLMKADAYSSSCSLLVNLEGHHYLLIPVALEEKEADYDLAKFRVIEQEGVEEGN